MKLSGERLTAWILAMLTLTILSASALLMVLSPEIQDPRYWEFLSGAILGCGAPILGLIILTKQPRNRIGWLWLVFGLAIAFISLAQGLKFSTGRTPAGEYPSLIFVLLLFSEMAYIVRFICMILMMLWFPDGNPPTPRWRVLHGWMVLSFFFLLVSNFAQKVPWSPVEGTAPGFPLVDNPIGFIPVTLSPIYNGLAPIGFLSIIGMSLLAILAMLRRYRAGGARVQAQIRWFVVGGVIYVASLIVSIILIDYTKMLPGILTNLATVPFYLAIGTAITRYRLYEIDLIIRRALQYALLTGLLGLTYFGGVVVLQSVLGSLTGQADSPLVAVLTTLGVAALFNPLRRRVQEFIDRRFYRRKYDAEQALAEFAAAASRETDLAQLSGRLTGTVQEALQPEGVSLWLKPTQTKEKLS